MTSQRLLPCGTVCTGLCQFLVLIFYGRQITYLEVCHRNAGFHISWPSRENVFLRPAELICHIFSFLWSTDSSEIHTPLMYTAMSQSFIHGDRPCLRRRWLVGVAVTPPYQIISRCGRTFAQSVDADLQKSAQQHA